MICQIYTKHLISVFCFLVWPAMEAAILSTLKGNYMNNPEENIESEPIEGVNIHENDILVPKRRLFIREVNSVRQWPSRIIPYEIDPKAGFVKNETDMLMLAFKEFADKTCVLFVPRTHERDYVFITTDPKRGCLSYIGWQGGRQEVFLLRPNCFYLKGTIIHELMHSIGFYHEHSRPDRDEHVQVMWDNIRPDKTSNFQIEQTGNMLNAPYDYLSLMHYSALTFSKDPENKEYSMVPKDNSFPADKLGQRRGFSPVDLQQILTFYNCPPRSVSDLIIDDLTAEASTHFDPEEAGSNRFPQAFRQARNGDWQAHENDVQFLRATSPAVLPPPISTDFANGNTSPGIIPLVPPSMPSPTNNGPCSNTFIPDAVLNFLGFFYLFKDGLYWKFTYAEGIFRPETNLPKSYKENFNADLPDKLDSVFSYLTYIYFVKGASVWVAKSDTEIRGPISLKQLFPNLPEIVWDNIFIRGANINFVWGTFTWLYDVKTDNVFGPTKGVQNPILLTGSVAELSDGLIAAFPKPQFLREKAQIYVLDRFADQILPGFPRSVSDTFC